MVKCFNGWFEDELLPHNNVKKCAWPRYADKQILFLEPEHIAQLFTLNWRGRKGDALWWFLLMCCTGLDYPDAVAYARNRKAYEVRNESGIKLVGRRKKPPHNEYHLPLLDEVERLFATHPTGPTDWAEGFVNLFTDQIEDELGINWRITAKTARKTFANLMLTAGHVVANVSLMLGHGKIGMTERHYVRVNGASIDRAMKRVRVNIDELAGNTTDTEGQADE